MTAHKSPDPLPDDLASLLRESAEVNPPGFSESAAGSRLARTLESGVPQHLAPTLAKIEATPVAPTGAELVIKGALGAKGLAAVAVVATGSAVVAYSGLTPDEVTRTAPQPPVVQVESAPESPEIDEDVEAAVQPAFDKTAEEQPAPPPAPRAAAPSAPTMSEVEHLAQVRKLVGQNPARAVRLAQEGHAQYRGGMLFQEREGLLILALESSGSRSQARQRARAYIKRFPQGALTDKLRPIASGQ